MLEIHNIRLAVLNDSSDTSQDETLYLLLAISKNLYLSLKYPFDYAKTDIPDRDNYWIILCVKELYQQQKENSIGLDNLQSYSENGLRVSFNDITNIITPSLRSMIIPKAGVPK